MDNELLQQMRSTALRLQPGKSDPIALAWAERDFRALRSRYAVHCLRAALAAIVGAGAGALAGAWAGARGAFARESRRFERDVASHRLL